jgi:hypothetical protein
MMDEINWGETLSYVKDIGSTDNDSCSPSNDDEDGNEEEVEDSKDDAG